MVCGKAGEYAATDEALLMLAGCEVYEGSLVIPYPTAGVLSSLTTLRVIVEGFGGTAGNPDLKTLEGLNRLEWVGSIQFSQDGLVDLSAMANLAGIDDGFQLFAMPDLVDCRGLEGLRTVGGGMRFELNDELSSLDGLSGLEWIGANLEILQNPKLVSLSGLSGLRQVDGDVLIQSNDLLPPAEISALLSRIQVGGEIHVD